MNPHVTSRRSAQRPPSEPSPSRVPAGLLAVVLGASLVVASLSFLVAVRAAQLQNGYHLYSLSREKAELLEERSHLQVEVAALKRPDRLARAAAELKLVPPRPDQLLREREIAVPADGDEEEGQP